jgi:hypothetical protein
MYIYRGGRRQGPAPHSTRGGGTAGRLNRVSSHKGHRHKQIAENTPSQRVRRRQGKANTETSTSSSHTCTRTRWPGWQAGSRCRRHQQGSGAGLGPAVRRQTGRPPTAAAAARVMPHTHTQVTRSNEGTTPAAALRHECAHVRVSTAAVRVLREARLLKAQLPRRPRPTRAMQHTHNASTPPPTHDLCTRTHTTLPAQGTLSQARALGPTHTSRSRADVEASPCAAAATFGSNRPAETDRGSPSTAWAAKHTHTIGGAHCTRGNRGKHIHDRPRGNPTHCTSRRLPMNASQDKPTHAGTRTRTRTRTRAHKRTTAHRLPQAWKTSNTRQTRHSESAPGGPAAAGAVPPLRCRGRTDTGSQC